MQTEAAALEEKLYRVSVVEKGNEITVSRGSHRPELSPRWVRTEEEERGCCPTGPTHHRKKGGTRLSARERGRGEGRALGCGDCWAGEGEVG